MLHRLVSLLLVAALATASAACEGMKGLLALQQGLAAEFDTRAVAVNVVNGTSLIVTFTNSRLGELETTEQAAACRRVAEYVRDHYPGYDRLDVISVAFADQRRVGPVSMTKSRMPCSLRTSDLGRPRRGISLQRPGA
ncbi:MAG TPA: hypothetical protein VFU46_08735 [Gemmatimonadales bacterium]|nr:hypothetical protein [Gemmatimonadales bacterium]